MLRSMAVVAILGGCEWVFPFEPGAVAPDGAPGGFGTPMKIQAAATGPTEYLGDPSLDVGETQISFTRTDPDAAGSTDIFIALASENPLAWTAAFPVEMSIAMQDEVNPELSADGLTMWLAVPTGTPVVRAFSRVAAAPNVWTDITGTEAVGLDDPAQTRPNSITPDGRHFVVHRVAATLPYLLEFQRTTLSDPWIEVPGTMDALNAAGAAANGHLSPDALELVFTLQPTGNTDYDLYYTRRAALGEPFETPVEIVELSSDVHETDPWLSADMRRIYFQRSYGGAPRSEWGIYYAER